MDWIILILLIAILINTERIASNQRKLILRLQEEINKLKK